MSPSSYMENSSDDFDPEESSSVSHSLSTAYRLKPTLRPRTPKKQMQHPKEHRMNERIPSYEENDDVAPGRRPISGHTDNNSFHNGSSGNARREGSAASNNSNQSDTHEASDFDMSLEILRNKARMNQMKSRSSPVGSASTYKPNKSARPVSSKTPSPDVSTRAKTSLSGYSAQTPVSQMTSRHSLSVAEYNRFKNSLLRNHLSTSLSYPAEDYVENEKGARTSEQSYYPADAVRPKIIRSTPETIDYLNGPTRAAHVSKIKSIYDALQRDSNLRVYSVDTKRQNYAKNMQRAHNFLSSSLNITKL
jgi:hypothetical protein